MTIEEITELFKWMAIINLILLSLSFAVSTILKSTISRIQSKMFGIPEARVQEILYGLFGTYKIAIIIFNFVPYITLLIIQ
jgi:hypothetical protein